MGIATRASRTIGRKPCLVFAVTVIATLVLSVLGLVVGKFSVSADNDGWQSRGTKLANRQMQYERLMNEGGGSDDNGPGCNPLRPDCWARPPAARRQLSRQQYLLSAPARWFRKWFESLTGRPVVAARRLSEGVDDGHDDGHQHDDGGHDGGCWNGGERHGDVVVIYRAADSTGDLLSPSLFQQVCELEGQILQLGRYTEACRGPEGGQCDTVNGGACLAPIGAVSSLRTATPGGWGMSCAELVADPTILSMLTAGLVSCIEQAASGGGSCESTRFVGFDFTAASPSTATLAATFPANEWASTQALKSSFNGGDIPVSSSDVRTAFGQLWSEGFEDEVMDELLMQDMILVQASMAVSLVFLLINTRSLLMSIIGLLQVGFSFPVAYFFYKLLCGFDFFPFLNFLGLFVIMGIGVDDLFVVIDKWTQGVRALPPGADAAAVAAAVGPDTALTMLLTSLTTSAAFFATSVVPVAPVRLFAIFMGFMVLADYVLCLAMSFPVACIQHRWLQHARKTQNRCVLGVLDFSSCCGGPADADAVPKPRLLERFMGGPVHTAVSKGRFLLVAFFLGAVGLCAWQAADIPLPKSSEVQLLPDSHMIQQYKVWSKDLSDSDAGDSWVSFVWGLEPGDTGDKFDPSSRTDLLADRSFDPTSEAAQQWLLDFCTATAAAPVSAADGESCPLRDMDVWLRDQWGGSPAGCGGATQMPVPAASFHSCVEAFVNDGWGDSWGRQRNLRMYNGKLAALVYHFKVTGIRWDSSYEELRDAVDAWEEWTALQSASAPEGVSRGFFTSGDFHWWDTNRSMLQGAYISIMTALFVVSGVVFFATLNLLTTLYATVAVAGVLLLVIGTVIGLGWELGFLEGICFAILIGLSCDFVLHMAHAYTSSPEGARQERSRDALTRMGPPVFAAAITTAATGAVMYGCTILFFLRFGTILVLTMVYAILVAIFFFLALTNAAGPTGSCCSLSLLCPRSQKSEAAV